MELTYLLGFSILYFGVFISALLTAVAITVLEGKFNVGCGLYVHPENSLTSYSTSTPYSTCKYITYVPVAVLLTSLVLFFYHFYPTLTLILKREPRYTVWPRVCLINSIISGILVFVGSCIISSGFSKTCTEVLKLKQVQGVISCKTMFSFMYWQKGHRDEYAYSTLSLAEVSSWVTFLCLASTISLSSYFIFLKGRFLNVPPTSSSSSHELTKY